MFWSIFLVALPAVHAALIPSVHDHNDESHAVSSRLPDTWYQPDDHPVHALFKRGAPGDGTNYPAVGSPTWSSAYPVTSPDVNQLPKEWVNALNAAVSAGKIPNIPQSSNTPGVNPVYPAGSDPNGQQVCSATYKCRIPGDIWDGPTGTFSISFDDGPTPVSSTLLQFLQAHNEIATHFVIGVNILQNPQVFQDIINAGHDIAVHTWTHPYMTTLSNLEILGQLGWTTEIIRNSTGGRVPKYWRPPFGDSDARVRAIAQEVFGLTTVIWNSDTEDWSLTSGGTTQSQIRDSFIKWLTAPSKTPGIVTLEHELSTESVTAFMNNYPMIQPNGWQTGSLARLIGSSVYQNSKDPNSPVALAGIVVGASTPSAGNSSASGTSSTSQSSQTQTTTSSTSTGNGNQSSQTSNAALVSRDIPWNLAYILIAFCAPTLTAMVSILA
ncbi:putative polysaccharide deacetylase [Lyophyllum shimeji]|uniref:chitin deacetylase n=1 Tax=Lyophyllum shimeji TaxID=47721 RepID=A0A9P3PD75_LYOSH|nr:putative polysaccharide deacetylase [Lyophyllum shimeji]